MLAEAVARAAFRGSHVAGGIALKPRGRSRFTLIENVHEEEAARLAPERLMTFVP